MKIRLDVVDETSDARAHSGSFSQWLFVCKQE